MKKWLAVSLILHLIIIGASLYVYNRRPLKKHALFVEIRDDNKNTPTDNPDNESNKTTLSGKTDQPFQYPRIESDWDDSKTATTDTLFKSSEDRNHLSYTMKEKQPLISLKRLLSSNDTVKTYRFSLGKMETQPIPHRDEIADQIKEQNLGGKQPLTAITPTFEKSKTEVYKPARFDFIPTKIQLQTMAVLYEEEKATQLNLYPRLSEASDITAEEFNNSLTELVKKGFLKRKKVSPESIFSLFGIPIEMSKKNKKNKVYQYETTVEKTKLMTYLQARLFFLKEKLNASPADSTKLIMEIRTLEDKIQILLN